MNIKNARVHPFGFEFIDESKFISAASPHAIRNRKEKFLYKIRTIAISDMNVLYKGCLLVVFQRCVTFCHDVILIFPVICTVVTNVMY